MLKSDRTLIAGLLLPHFPEMKGASSGEWHDFLNDKTGLAIPDDEPNATAFDKWREALAAQHNIPVWGETPERAAIRAERLAKMLERQP
jgi:hypothetical protein